MYEYKYVEVIMEAIGFFTSKKPNYQEIINENAQNGWRLVQILAKEHSSEGRPWKHVAIFERNIG